MFRPILIVLVTLAVNLLSLQSSTALASEPPPFDRCVCMTGEPPSERRWEESFYHAGCTRWLSQLHCTAKIQIPNDLKNGFSKTLSSQAPRSRIAWGYVGHWANAQQTLDWLEKDVLPTASVRDFDLTIDNTACSGGDSPALLKKGLEALLEKYPLGTLDLKVNQTISSGMWDPYLPGKNNFWVEVHHQENHTRLTFPKCEAFEGHSCWGWIQKSEMGFCLDAAGETSRLRALRCAPVTTEFWTSTPGRPAGRLHREKRTQFKWENLAIEPENFSIGHAKMPLNAWKNWPKMTTSILTVSFEEEVIGIAFSERGARKLIASITKNPLKLKENPLHRQTPEMNPGKEPPPEAIRTPRLFTQLLGSFTLSLLLQFSWTDSELEALYRYAEQNQITR
ncbi:MAG: hypothetical protein RJB38_1049 [Pseudomonadota bacterium]|jgi:hypothetical protein